MLPNLSSYLVAVHNKRTNTTVFRSAPLHIMNQQVKALKNLAPIEVTNEERMQQRNKLGEAFGTKKAKAAIRAQERNRVDIDALKGVTGHLQETIEENTSSLPTLGELSVHTTSRGLHVRPCTLVLGCLAQTILACYLSTSLRYPAAIVFALTEPRRSSQGSCR